MVGLSEILSDVKEESRISQTEKTPANEAQRKSPQALQCHIGLKLEKLKLVFKDQMWRVHN